MSASSRPDAAHPNNHRTQRTLPPNRAETRLGGWKTPGSLKLSQPLLHWRRLTIDLGQIRVKARIAGRGRRPNRHGRLHNIRIVQGAGANDGEMRTRVRRTKNRRTAFWAKAPVHVIATVGDTPVVL